MIHAYPKYILLKRHRILLNDVQKLSPRKRDSVLQIKRPRNNLIALCIKLNVYADIYVACFILYGFH